MLKVCARIRGVAMTPRDSLAAQIIRKTRSRALTDALCADDSCVMPLGGHCKLPRLSWSQWMWATVEALSAR